MLKWQPTGSARSTFSYQTASSVGKNHRERFSPLVKRLLEKPSLGRIELLWGWGVGGAHRFSSKFSKEVKGGKMWSSKLLGPTFPDPDRLNPFTNVAMATSGLSGACLASKGTILSPTGQKQDRILH